MRNSIFNNQYNAQTHKVFYPPGNDHISPKVMAFWVDDFPNFPFGGICENFLEGMFFFCGSDDGSCGLFLGWPKDGPWLGLFNLSVRSSSLDTLLKTQQVSGMRSLDGKNPFLRMWGETFKEKTDEVYLKLSFFFFFGLQTW